MIDTHAHIDSDAFDADREEVIEEAKRDGVQAIIIPAVESSGFDRIQELAERYDFIYFAPGIHPHSAKDATDENLARVMGLAQHPKAAAIGEIGLDYYYNFAPRDEQVKAFRRQLQIAKLMNLPAIIHNRDSDEDLLNILKEEQDGTLKGVLHCFSGNVDFLNRALDCGMHVSFTGNVTFKKSTLDETVKQAPDDRIMLETDSPYMTPAPFRGKRNTPSKVLEVAKKIAEIKSIPIDEILKMTTENAKKFFNLFLLALFFIAAPLMAQETEEDEELTEEPVQVQKVHPYPKFIGIGPTIGTNVVIEVYKYKEGNERVPSYPAIFTYGGTLQYQPFDYLILEGTYLFAENKQIAIDNPGLDPTVYNTFEFTTNWIANPYNRVNFFGTIGLGYVSTKYSTWDTTLSVALRETRSDLAITPGVGLMVNFPLGNAGLIVVKGEWRLDFLLGKVENVFDYFEGQYRLSDRTTYFSIPRLSIIYHPKLWD